MSIISALLLKIILFAPLFGLGVIWAYGTIRLQMKRNARKEPALPRICIYCGAEMEPHWWVCADCGGEQALKPGKYYNFWWLGAGMVPGGLLSYILPTVLLGVCSSLAYWLGGLGGAISGLFVGWLWNADKLAAK